MCDQKFVVVDSKFPRVFRHLELRRTRANKPEIEKVSALRATRRSFDCATRDETTSGSAQDDNF